MTGKDDLENASAELLALAKACREASQRVGISSSFTSWEELPEYRRFRWIQFASHLGDRFDITPKEG